MTNLDTERKLPFDAYYYPELKLVIEYNGSQHSVPTSFFDNKLTVSGVSRGDQRRIYDQRRRYELPKHGIKLVIISCSDFGNTKKLARNKDCDEEIIKSILSKNGIE